MPHSEIAATLAIPLGTVKSRLRLAYERLRPLLEDLQ
jgi:RNA polymerase sigma-70 factor (ECF subfamily)